jgi:molecular chaperone DnaJ
MEFEDAYETLGVAKDAPPAEIRKAYRQLALNFHPDHNPENPEAENRFKEIVIAYETLKDPERRADYDKGQRRPTSSKTTGGYTEEWEEVFSQIFQRAREKNPETEGADGLDLQAQIEISLEKAASGTEREITVQRWIRCSHCSGRGTDPQAKPVVCRLCGGTGEVRFKRGLAEVVIPCNTCQGTGSQARKKCRECRGDKRRRMKESLTVTIPAAVEDGSELHIRGKGDESVGWEDPGTLHVTVRIAPHPFFKREGNDLLFDMPITFSQAALGAEVTVPTLDGSAIVRVPAGTQTGQLFRLRGKGFSPAGGRHRGDQLVNVFVETPTRLSRQLRRLLEEFQEHSADSTYPLRKRFLDKLKSFLA